MSSSAHLNALFNKHRVVFWYDPAREFSVELAEYHNPDVCVVHIANNELQVKYRILIEEPTQKFLLYIPAPEPAHIDNWLLDIQMSNVVYRNDRISLWLDELNWPDTYRPLIEMHQAFFGNKERRHKLAVFVPTPDREQIIMGMLAVVANARMDINDIVLSVLANAMHAHEQQDASDTESSMLKLMRQYHLWDYFWLEIAATYNYSQTPPTLLDFVFALFTYGYAESIRASVTHAPINPPYQLNVSAIALLSLWKDSATYAEAYKYYAKQCYDNTTTVRLHVEDQDIRVLGDIDWFYAIDKLIINQLASAILNQSLGHSEVDSIIRKRMSLYWSTRDSNLKMIYVLLQHASTLTHLVNTCALDIHNPDHAVIQYTKEWYKIDQHYRHFIASRSAIAESLSDAIKPLIDKVEDQYINIYLNRINTLWQDHINPMQSWPWPGATSQRMFFESVVKPVVTQKKLCVIIADGFRYEMAEELQRLLMQQNTKNLSSMISVLPSYTQLGQAALLPHTTLEIRSDIDNSVLVDNRLSTGLSNRTAILQANSGVSSVAYTFEDFIPKTSDERKQIIQDYQLVYIYHNSVDTTGENNEQALCDLSVTFINDIRRLVVSLLSANASNVILTADHGFLYQHRAPADGDFMQYSHAAAGTVVSQNRRMVIGHDLPEAPSLKKWNASQLNLQGNTTILIPYGTVRLRRQGAQKHYSHGGASLQEIIVPLLHINSKRQRQEVQTVSVNIIRGGTTTITTAQLPVKFYQEDAVSDMMLPRTIRAGLIAADNTALTPQYTIVFDNPSDNPRDREKSQVFTLLPIAKQYNQQEVFLRIEEKINGTEQYNEIERFTYKLRRAMIIDDDDE
jgi:uncharacterized protein (TIGR02687 family)